MRVKRSAPITVRDVYGALDAEYPFRSRADWDNVGILLGDPERPVERVLVALDATPAVIGRCRRMRADLLVTHHPVVFSPLKAVRPDRPASAAPYALLAANVAVISAHTNADVAPRGVSHAIARRLGLSGVAPLIPGEEPADTCKVAVFVPRDYTEAVYRAMIAAGAGRIGAYEGCSFRAEGIGTFVPSEKASPFIGRAGREERVPEVRLETIARNAIIPRVLSALRAAHPYEEPAVDVYPVKGGTVGGGMGAVGDLPRAVPLGEALAGIRSAIRPSWMRVAGPSRKKVRRIAVVGGSGAEYAGAAADAGADLFVTGDLRYHQALEAASGEMAVVDVGHGSAEKWILPEFQRVIAERCGSAADVRVFMEQEPQREWRGEEGEG